jgi:hypothetical protein
MLIKGKANAIGAGQGGAQINRSASRSDRRRHIKAQTALEENVDPTTQLGPSSSFKVTRSTMIEVASEQGRKAGR